MFCDLSSLHAILARLERHPLWSSVVDNIDKSVYNNTQNFRVPGALKAPAFDGNSRKLNTTLAQNVQLPVDHVSGCLFGNFMPGPFLTIPLKIWFDHLVTTPLSTQSLGFDEWMTIGSHIDCPSHMLGASSVLMLCISFSVLVSPGELAPPCSAMSCPLSVPVAADTAEASAVGGRVAERESWVSRLEETVAKVLEQTNARSDFLSVVQHFVTKLVKHPHFLQVVILATQWSL